jgi:hypothetical protein
MRIALYAIWFLAVVAGMGIILNYDNTSGVAGVTSRLVMFAHPVTGHNPAIIQMLVYGYSLPDNPEIQESKSHGNEPTAKL